MELALLILGVVVAMLCGALALLWKPKHHISITAEPSSEGKVPVVRDIDDLLPPQKVENLAKLTRSRGLVALVVGKKAKFFSRRQRRLLTAKVLGCNGDYVWLRRSHGHAFRRQLVAA